MNISFTSMHVTQIERQQESGEESQELVRKMERVLAYTRVLAAHSAAAFQRNINECLYENTVFTVKSDNDSKSINQPAALPVIIVT